MTEDFFRNVAQWATQEVNIDSIIVVGSYARETSTDTSDIDLCIITSNKEKMIKTQDFVKEFGNPKKTQTEYYGACTSIRVWYTNGLEVEFGIVEPSWIKMPLDLGTYKVLRDGYKVIIDKKQYFSDLNIVNE